jgi:3-methylcrotonyl-CoA carboxylase alpha subunit
LPADQRRETLTKRKRNPEIILMRKISRVLIVNRGEIACRIIRTLRKRQITSIVVFTAVEKHSLHVRMADEAVLMAGESLQETYLNVPGIVNIALECRADAIHPGYGFLSENAEFAEVCTAHGLIFLGPEADVIRFMGDKIAARKLASSLGIPVLPSAIGTPSQLINASERLKFPLLIKAAAGGGGLGMQLVNSSDQLHPAMEKCSREAAGWFGDGSIYLEEYIDEAKHIEVQIFGDGKGEVIHLFERECSIQRRYQKFIEESPSPTISEKQRAELLQMAVTLAASKKYRSSGTVEFLLTPGGEFFFLEMNTRIQVEHTVTEEVTGIDLVDIQLELAETGLLPIRQEDVRVHGHSIEARIYAEDIESGFMPSPGTITLLKLPSIDGLRLESAFDGPVTMPDRYDPLIAKLISFGKTREENISLLSLGLQEFNLLGIHTNKKFLEYVLCHDTFISGKYTTNTAEQLAYAFINQVRDRKSYIPAELPVIAWIAAMSQQVDVFRGPYFQARLLLDKNPMHISWDHLGNEMQVKYGGKLWKPEIIGGSDKFHIRLEDKIYSCSCFIHPGNHVDLEIDGLTYNLKFDYENIEKGREIASDGEDILIDIVAPLHGRIVKINFKPGERFEKENAVLVIEAMKMENNIHAGSNAELVVLYVEPGTQVSKGQLLCRIKKNNSVYE